MTTQSRKEAITAYKERKSVSGVYAVICSATGEVWVGISRNLEAQQNGLWFALRMGGSPNRSLQAVFTEHGEAEFRYEELERLSEDFSDLAKKDELKRRKTLWQARLFAQSLL